MSNLINQSMDEATKIATTGARLCLKAAEEATDLCDFNANAMAFDCWIAALEDVDGGFWALAFQVTWDETFDDTNEVWKRPERQAADVKKEIVNFFCSAHWAVLHDDVGLRKALTKDAEALGKKNGLTDRQVQVLFNVGFKKHTQERDRAAEECFEALVRHHCAVFDGNEAVATEAWNEACDLCDHARLHDDDWQSMDNQAHQKAQDLADEDRMLEKAERHQRAADLANEINAQLKTVQAAITRGDIVHVGDGRFAVRFPETHRIQVSKFIDGQGIIQQFKTIKGKAWIGWDVEIVPAAA